MTLLGTINVIFLIMAVASWIGAAERRRFYDKRIVELEAQFQDSARMAAEVIRQARRITPMLERMGEQHLDNMR